MVAEHNGLFEIGKYYRKRDALDIISAERRYRTPATVQTICRYQETLFVE